MLSGQQCRGNQEERKVRVGFVGATGEGFLGLKKVEEIGRTWKVQTMSAGNGPKEKREKGGKSETPLGSGLLREVRKYRRVMSRKKPRNFPGKRKPLRSDKEEINV